MVRTKSEEIDFLVERDGAACHYCGRRLNRWQMTRDHVIPRTQLQRWRRDHIKFPKGFTKLGNMVLACKPCNVSKGDMAYEDFWALGKATREIKRRKIERAIERKHIRWLDTRSHWSGHWRQK